MIPRRILARLRDDRGLTLTELVVAMAISGIVGALTVALVVSMSDSSRATTERAAATAEARVAFDEWRDLLAVRESPVRDESSWPAVEKITGSSVAFYSSLGNRTGSADPTAPTLIRISAEGGRLREERFHATDPGAAVPTYPAAPSSTRLLSLDATLEVAAFTAQGAPIPLSASPDATQRAQIDRIELTVTITDDRGVAHTFGAVS